MSHEFPLAGLRVIDASQGLAGPSAAMTLAQYGADVIKVEPLEGDWSRGVGSGAQQMTSLCVSTNNGKRSIALDLKQPEGAAIMRRLTETADVFLESFRTGVMARLGFGYEQISSYNPEVIYLAITGFGQQGPLRELPATDAVLQAFSGMMSINKGSEDGLPIRLTCWPIDIVTGIYAVQAIMAALYARRDSGADNHVGRYIDASLLQGALGLQAGRIMEHVASGGAARSATAFPVGTFRTADGFINVSVLKDALWPAFCTVIGRPDLAAQSDLLQLPGRRARAGEIMRIATDVFAQYSSAHWSEQLRSAGILNERISNYDEMLAHPQIAATQAFTWVQQPGIGRVPHVNVPGPTPLQDHDSRARAPRLGEHTREILAGLGYTPPDIDALERSKAVLSAAAEPTNSAEQPT